MLRLIKYITQPLYTYFISTISNIVLLSRNPTLKAGKNISITNCKLGRYNYLATCATLNNSTIGDYSYFGENTKINNSKIGKFSCIGPGVLIGLGEHPACIFASVHPVFYSSSKRVGVSFVNKNYFDEFPTKVTIGNDVWIGARVIVTRSVSIGNGAIVAAGSIITKDVAPYSIVAGAPAKVIKMRFTDEQIDFLHSMKWWDRPDDWLKHNAKLFHDVDALCKMTELYEHH